MLAETTPESSVSQVLLSTIIINKSLSIPTGQEASLSLILMSAHPSSATSPSSTSFSLDLSALTAQTTHSSLMELAGSIVLKGTTQLEKKYVLIVGRDITGMEQHV